MMVLPRNLQEKLDKLITLINGKKVITAYSGGLDSSLLAFLAQLHAQKALAILIENSLTPETEIIHAKRFAKDYSLSLKIVNLNILDNKNFSQNLRDRCYICKKAIFEKIIEIKEDLKYDLIIEGSNLDDLDDFRPGMNALKELGIKSLYIKADISKKEIRMLSNHFNLPTASKPSMACLASRISTGQPVTKKKLKMIDQAEQFLKDTYNLQQLRVRLHKNNLARIEFEKRDFPQIFQIDAIETIRKRLKKIGFLYITIDLDGYQSGSMNLLHNKGT